MLSTEPTTPRTAEETMWVMGEVTLIDNKLARLIKKPKTPWSVVTQWPKITFHRRHTVIAEPQRKVLKGDIAVVEGPVSEKREVIAGTSPAMMITGIKAMALYRFVYHDK